MANEDQIEELEALRSIFENEFTAMKVQKLSESVHGAKWMRVIDSLMNGTADHHRLNLSLYPISATETM
uniref:Uncharacterized protein n=1 Tax=Magallana gigas TaxID=29159 RepID=K1PXA7_MAGGI